MLQDAVGAIRMLSLSKGRISLMSMCAMCVCESPIVVSVVFLEEESFPRLMGCGVIGDGSSLFFHLPPPPFVI